MGSKIFWFCIFAVLCVGAWFVYQHIHEQKQMDSGDVTWEAGQPTPEDKAKFDKENSGDTPDGQSERKQHTAAQDAAIIANGQTNVGPAANTPAAAAPAAAASTTTPAPPAQPAMAPGSFALGTGAAPANLPATDSVPPNPTNGARFTGSGAYQWYRQGNLTWRVDTVSGGSCIAFATLEEWRKQIVYSHGCGRGA